MYKTAFRTLQHRLRAGRAGRQILAGALALCFLLSPAAALAQDPAPGSEELKKLQEEIDLLKKRIEKAEAEKKLSDLTATKNPSEQALDEEIELTNKRATKAEADKKLLKAYLPSSQTTALEGSLTADDKATAEAEWMARTVMGEIANRMGQMVAGLSPTHVIFYNKPDIVAFEKYETVKNQIDSTSKLYAAAMSTESDDELGPASFLMAPELASTVLKSVIDVVALFRTDTTVKGLSFEVDDAAVVARFVKGLKSTRNGATVYLPAAFPILKPEAALASGTRPSRQQAGILDSVSSLYEQKEKASAIIARCEQPERPAPANPVIEKLDEEIQILKRRVTKAEAEKALAELTGYRPAPAPAEPTNRPAATATAPAATPAGAAPRATCSPALKLKLPTLKALNQQTEKFLSELTKVDDTSGNSALASLMRAENMKRALPDDNSFVVHVKAKAAGNNITKRSLWTGTKREHSAVVTLTYLVYRKDGSVVDGDDITGRMGPTKFATSRDVVISSSPTGRATGAEVGGSGGTR